MRGSHVKWTSWTQQLIPNKNVKTGYSFLHFFTPNFTQYYLLLILIWTFCFQPSAGQSVQKYPLISWSCWHLCFRTVLSPVTSLWYRRVLKFKYRTLEKGNYRKFHRANAETVLTANNGVLRRLVRIFSLHFSLSVWLFLIRSPRIFIIYQSWVWQGNRQEENTLPLYFYDVYLFSLTFSWKCRFVKKQHLTTSV